MTTVEVLRAARALYKANPSHAPSGVHVETRCVCLVYALSDAAGDADYWPAQAAIRRAAPCGSLVEWNAKHSTEEVLAAFDRAIEAQERAACP